MSQPNQQQNINTMNNQSQNSPMILNSNPTNNNNNQANPLL